MFGYKFIVFELLWLVDFGSQQENYVKLCYDTKIDVFWYKIDAHILKGIENQQKYTNK